jgi:hypothetical protein
VIEDAVMRIHDCGVRPAPLEFVADALQWKGPSETLETELLQPHVDDGCLVRRKAPDYDSEYCLSEVN